MKFDNIVGNPPYNKGLDVNFLDLVHKICNKHVCMILTAKWLLAETDRIINNVNCGRLRDTYIEHVSKIVYFPCSKDVFDIMQSEGIVYFLYDKNNTYSKCEITNICDENRHYNSEQTRCINNREPLLNVVWNIIEKCKIQDSFKFNHQLDRRYQVWVNGKTPGGGFYSLSKTKPDLLVLGKARVIDTYNNENGIEDSKAVFSSDSLEECKSYISYLDTKLVRFLVLGCLGKLSNIMTDDNFRYVPYTDDFSFMYTDEYMYRKYNLSNEQIEIIENTISNRNQTDEI